MPLVRPAPDAPVATLWVMLAALFHGEPTPRAGNPGFARGMLHVAEVYTAARAVERLIRYLGQISNRPCTRKYPTNFSRSGSGIRMI